MYMAKWELHGIKKVAWAIGWNRKESLKLNPKKFYIFKVKQFVEPSRLEKAFGQMQYDLYKTFGQTTYDIFYRTVALCLVFMLGQMLDDEIRTFALC